MIFNSEFFTKNRKSLRQSAEVKLMIIAANGLLQRNADTTYKFSQDANFWYLTGINEPDILLVINGEDEFLIVPGRSESRKAFDGSVSSSVLSEISGVQAVFDEEVGWRKISELIKSDKSVGVLGAPSSYIDAHGIYTNPARKRLCSKLHKLNSEISLNSINEDFRDLRVVKQPEEIEAIKQAIEITAQALKSVGSRKDYSYEYEIEAEITKVMRSNGSTGHAYEPIVASGERACTLHYVENNGEIKKSDYIVIDVGAEVEHYAADITRTVCLRTPSPRMKEVYNSVLNVHRQACNLLKSGITMREFEEGVRNFMGEELVALGLVETATKEAVNKYYPHATSHFLGLNVHDVGDYEAPLQEGMVITVEPGIYIKEEGIGVRLEDDVLITKTGILNLSEDIPK